jgi:2-polyprenyl-6-methoxyphenol hydroxylase-like FAD-dependent oxidoreductase
MNDPSPAIKTSVVIVGAGPTGLSLAAQLLRYNIDFILLEKNEKTTPLSKALVVQARTLEIFDELGIAQKAIAEGKLTAAMNFFYKGKQRGAINIAGLGKGISPFPFALSLEQSKTEKLLLEHVMEKGKAVQWNCVFNDVEEKEDGVIVTYQDENRQLKSIQAGYLVGCDGAASAVRHKLGLAFEGDTVPKLFYVADVILKSSVINRDELYMFMIKKGFVLFFPMEGEGHYRIVGILPDADAEQQFSFETIAIELKEQLKVPIEFQPVTWFSTYRVHSRKATAFSKGRCFIAGDAAHIHTPAGGQGMNTGIQDSYNLAWKMAFVLNEKIGSKMLETYSEERGENARHLLRSTDRMFELLAGTNGILNFIRLNILPNLLGLAARNRFLNKRIFPLISQTGITYHENSLVVKSAAGKVKAGVRMPYLLLPGGEPVFQHISAPAFKILSFGKINTAIVTRLQEQFPGIQSLDLDEIPADIFGTLSRFFIILRPDNHIAYIGNDPGAVSNFFQRIMI